MHLRNSGKLDAVLVYEIISGIIGNFLTLLKLRFQDYSAKHISIRI